MAKKRPKPKKRAAKMRALKKARAKEQAPKGATRLNWDNSSKRGQDG